MGRGMATCSSATRPSPRPTIGGHIHALEHNSGTPTAFSYGASCIDRRPHERPGAGDSPAGHNRTHFHGHCCRLDADGRSPGDFQRAVASAGGPIDDSTWLVTRDRRGSPVSLDTRTQGESCVGRCSQKCSRSTPNRRRTVGDEQPAHAADVPSRRPIGSTWSGKRGGACGSRGLTVARICADRRRP